VPILGRWWQSNDQFSKNVALCSHSTNLVGGNSVEIDLVAKRFSSWSVCNMWAGSKLL
jgi:hypothetical protein